MTDFDDTPIQRAAGFTDGNKTRERLRQQLLGHIALPQPCHMIDSGVAPFVPFGWSIEEHRSNGHFVWDRGAVALWLPEPQLTHPLTGLQVRQYVKDKPALNAAVLDYLFEHPDLIPEAWEGQCVFFWGTIYRRHTGLAVRALFLQDGVLNFCSRLLTRRWSAFGPAAILQS